MRLAAILVLVGLASPAFAATWGGSPGRAPEVANGPPAGPANAVEPPSGIAPPSPVASGPTPIGTWLNLTPTGLPASRSGDALVYDPLVGRVILFGGGTSGPNQETWAYDPALDKWEWRSPKNRPGSRYWHAMDHDTGLGRIVVFGGTEGSAAGNNETWLYDSAGDNWTRLSIVKAPATRFGDGFAYDRTTSRHLMFGGGPISGPMNDTWLLDAKNATWTRLSSASPPPARTFTTMAADPAGGRVLLFGGRILGGRLGDSWLFDTVARTWTNITPATSPTARAWHSLVQDPVNRRAILLSGDDITGRLLQDMWAFSFANSTWTQLPQSSLLPGRTSGGLAFVPPATLVSFGGNVGTDVDGETWKFAFPTLRWVRTVDAIAPSARFGSAAAYDPDTDRYVMQGGSNFAGVSIETWVFDNNTKKWTNARPAISPGARLNHAMVYLPRQRQMMLFGGVGGDNSTWYYDVGSATWSFQTLSPRPVLRTGVAMAYHPGADTVVMFGGSGCANLCDDTWLYNATARAWANVTRPGGPEGRSLHAMSYEPGRRRIVMFGGAVGTGAQFVGDTWLYDFANLTWEEVKPKKSPSGRCCHSLHHDPGSDAVLLFAGADSFGKNSELWQYDAGRNWWSEVTPLSGPAKRMSHGAAFDPGRKTMLVVAGISGTAQSGLWSNETWIYYGGRPAPMPPKVVRTSPANGATKVPTLTPIEVEFDQEMNVTATAGAVLLSPPVAGSSINVSGRLLRLTHTTPFAIDEDYTVVVTTNAKSVHGLELQDTHIFGFRTGKTSVPRPPFVVRTQPQDGETGVAAGARIEVWFDQQMDPAPTRGALSTMPVLAGASVAVEGNSSHISSIRLQAGTEYLVSVSTNATSIDGDAMVAPYSFRFRAAPPPRVENVLPRDGTTRVDRSPTIEVVFTEPMSPDPRRLRSVPEASWNGSFSADGLTLTARPDSPLSAARDYIMIVDGNATSLDSFAMGSDYAWTFSTAPEPKSPALVSSTDILWLGIGALIALLIVALILIVRRLRSSPRRRAKDRESEEEEGEEADNTDTLGSGARPSQSPLPDQREAARRAATKRLRR